MEKRVLIDTFEKVTKNDFMNFGRFPQGSLDTIMGEVLIPDKAFSGFSVVETGAAEVTVGNGHLFANGKVYFNDSEGGSVISLLSLLPAVTKRIVAITVWGSEIDTQVNPRTFLVDADTRATVARATATERWRWANIGTVAGIEGPDPSSPAVSTDVLVVAWVTLSTTGVESIVRADENLVPTLRNAYERLNEVDIWRRLVGARLDTIVGDLLALAARILGAASFEFVQRVTADVARIKDRMHLPQVYTAWAADHYLDTSQSDTVHVDWLARIEEGVRFPPAAGFDAQLGLLNPVDASVMTSSNVLLPAWDPILRLTNVAYHAEVAIAQYTFQTTDMVQKSMSRLRVRYGTPFTVCTNAQWWQEGTYNPWSGLFTRAGDVFEVDNTIIDNMVTGDFNLRLSHGVVRLKQVWYDTVEEPYWDKIVTNFSIGGSMIAQTFVNSQDGWLAEVDIPMSRIANTGDVTMMICETINGAPAFDRVIAKAVVTAANLKVATLTNPVMTKFMFNPTFLGKGRYAIVMVTPGNHYVWVAKNTNSVSGTFFYVNDGAWAQGDLTTDLSFDIYFCKFRQNQTRVQLNSLTLTGGIAAVDINADAIVPNGTRLFWEVQIAGAWVALDNVEGGPAVQFIGLPPLLPFRAVFVGTESLMPALGVASNSRVTTWRPRSDFKHISTARVMPSAITKVTVDIRLEAWRGAPHHTHVCKLLHGAGYATVRPPDVTTEEVAPDDPAGAIIRHYTFVGMGAITQFKLRQEGTTDNVLTTYHVAEKIDIGIP